MFWSRVAASLLSVRTFRRTAMGAAYPGVSFRELNDIEGPTRLNFRACLKQGAVENVPIRSVACVAAFGCLAELSYTGGM